MNKNFSKLFFILVLLLFGGCTDNIFPDPCTNQLLKEVTSLSKDYIAVISVTECGGTTDFGTGVQILRNNEKMDFKRTDNLIFTAKSWNENIDLQWFENNRLLVSYKGRTDWIYIQKSEYLDIKIEYEIVEEDKSKYYRKSKVEKFLEFLSEGKKTEEDVENFLKNNNLQEGGTTYSYLKEYWESMQEWEKIEKSGNERVFYQEKLKHSELYEVLGEDLIDLLEEGDVKQKDIEALVEKNLDKFE